MRTSSGRMLRHRVQGVCCPFARSSQFPQVVEGAGGVRSAGREPVGTMKSSLVSQAVILDCGVTFLLGQRPGSWHCANRGEPRLCACCRRAPALTSRGSVCCYSVGHDTSTPLLTCLVGTSPQAAAKWSLHVFCFCGFLYCLG